MLYDLHTLQNRFYLAGNAVASLHTAVPLLRRRIAAAAEKAKDGEEDDGPGSAAAIDCVAFPDDGAAKRFATYFDDAHVHIIVCGKTRGIDDRRSVRVQEGDAAGRNIVVVDDLVQTGGTLYETGRILKEAGAASVCAFVSHAVFPGNSWTRFNRGGDRACFDKFWVTNSIPTVTDQLPTNDGIFEVLDLTDLIVSDLDHYSSNHSFRE
jgi:phosphoribosylpyrophosphate synthetase